MKKLLSAVLLFLCGCAAAYGQQTTITASQSAYSIGGASIGLTTAGDVFCVGGSSTKQVRVQQIRVSGSATIGGFVDALVVKRAAVDTGGTASAMTLAAMDSTFPLATSSASAFTVAPTGGAAVGVVRAARVVVAGAASSIALTPTLYDFSASPPYLLLRNPNELACVNVGAAGAGAAWDVDISVTEQ